MTRIEELKRANERIAYPLGIAMYPELSRAEVRELCALYESEIARKDAALRGMAAQLHAVHAVDQVPFLKGAIGAALQIYDSALTAPRETDGERLAGDTGYDPKRDM